MRRLLASVAAVLAVACSSVVDDTASGEAASTEGRPLTVIKGRAWASCWFDTAGDSASLSCKSTARGDDPIGATVEISAAGLGTSGAPGAFQSGRATLDIEAGGTVTVATFSRAAFPVVLLMKASFTNEGRAAIGETSRLSYIGMSPKIARPEDLPAARPAVLKQPFDLWPAAFIDGTGNAGGFQIGAQEYRRSIAPYQGFLDTEREIRTAPQLLSRDAKGKVQYFVAPASGAITLTVRSAGRESRFALEGPGYYTATRQGLRAATPAEIAADFPGSAQPATGSPATGEPSTPGTPDGPTTPADPDPSCGGNGQARCSNGACDPGTRLNTSVGKCVACGDDGETYCYSDPNGTNQSSTWRCNPGTRYDSRTTKCVACGNDGQTYCYSDPNGTNQSSTWRCNAGTRYNSSLAKCVACGAQGQTYCYSDPNGTNQSSSWRCNAGLRIVNGICTP